MRAPQIIWIILTAMDFAIVLVKNGTPKGDYDVGIYIVALAVNIGLLWWGGFFTN